MAKPKKRITEYRNYPLSASFPILLASRERNKYLNMTENTLRFHSSLEIAFCHEGHGNVEFDDAKVPFKKNDIVIIPKNLPHAIRSAKGTESIWSYIYLDIEEILKSFMLEGTTNVGISVGEVFEKNIVDEKNSPVICRVVKKILYELEQKKTGFQFSIRGLVAVLYVELMRLEETEDEEKRKNNLWKKKETEDSLAIAPALKYIEDNYMFNFHTEQLASECHLSPTHFRRLFNEVMKISPLEYLNNLRILKACTLLQNTEESILMISEKVGFRSVSSFNRLFLRTMQCSPRDYRKSIRESEGIV